MLYVFVLICFIIFVRSPEMDYTKYRYYFYFFGATILINIPKLLLFPFILVEFILNTTHILKRARFISITGIILSVILFLNIAYGMIYNKTNFKVNHITLYFKNLPPAFDNFKIVQFSDAHLGSFSGIDHVSDGIDLINRQHADMIVFTGDMINMVADEMNPFLSSLSQLHAPFGQFAILGNHDMNDYRKVDSVKADIEKNMFGLINEYKKTPIQLMLDESILIRKGKDSIVLIGIKNWGKPPFHQYGDLVKAMKGVGTVPFKILLSHDPPHWEAEVKGKTNIDLTLAGHTHGFQFGINLDKFQWSPVQYQYHHWLGLYSENKQYLYVNAGFGFIGFPGRVGIRPEIAVFTLKKL